MYFIFHNENYYKFNEQTLQYSTDIVPRKFSYTCDVAYRILAYRMYDAMGKGVQNIGYDHLLGN